MCKNKVVQKNTCITQEEIDEAKAKYCTQSGDVVGIFECCKCGHMKLFPSSIWAPDINYGCPYCGKSYRVTVATTCSTNEDDSNESLEVNFIPLNEVDLTCRCGHKGAHLMHLENPLAECKKCGTNYTVRYGYDLLESFTSTSWHSNQDCQDAKEKTADTRANWIKSTLENFPSSEEDIITFIADTRYHQGCDNADTIINFFSAGYCYYFALMLHRAFGGTILWHKDYSHIVWTRDEKPTSSSIAYDIDGVFYDYKQGSLVPVEALKEGINAFLQINTAGKKGE